MLQTFAGSGEDLPNLILQVAHERRFDQDSAFGTLFERVYQQYSLSTAAYAVVPHLVAIGSPLSDEQSEELWHSIGLMAATHDVKLDEAPPDLVDEFRSALLIAERRCIGLLLKKQGGPTEIYELSLACLGLSGHPLGKLVMDHYTPEGKAETAAICPRCNTEVQIAAFESGFVVEDPNSAGYPLPPRPEIPLTEPTIQLGAPRPDNPWAPFGVQLTQLANQKPDLAAIRSHLLVAAATAELGVTPATQAAAVFSLLGALLALKGHPQAARRYFHAWDTVSCSACNANFVFAERWWGLQST
ncbi:MAG TPA: hypothetical protein VMS40_10740 [Vicinamibacterales bacterium]|nr:hypothetical protein [Vicinamibacterales bacterium]